ncbi:MAG: type II toxin-antitoxin system RelE/ParE family toxin [Chitinophagaceae bacterium]|nr:type II toxin-antitoxin system RelE/ParE family toxin [Chitinophagaceae bacterium]
MKRQPIDVQQFSKDRPALKSILHKTLHGFCLAEQTNDPRLFKKLQKDIWELRVRFGRKQIRLLAFWDKANDEETLVLATHGFIKKVDKVPANEIERAINIRTKYFESKSKK